MDIGGFGLGGKRAAGWLAGGGWGVWDVVWGVG